MLDEKIVFKEGENTLSGRWTRSRQHFSVAKNRKFSFRVTLDSILCDALILLEGQITGKTFV